MSLRYYNINKYNDVIVTQRLHERNTNRMTFVSKYRKIVFMIQNFKSIIFVNCFQYCEIRKVYNQISFQIKYHDVNLKFSLFKIFFKLFDRMSTLLCVLT